MNWMLLEWGKEEGKQTLNHLLNQVLELVDSLKCQESHLYKVYNKRVNLKLFKSNLILIFSLKKLHKLKKILEIRRLQVQKHNLLNLHQSEE